MNGSTPLYLFNLALHNFWQSALLLVCVLLAFKLGRRWSAESRYWVWTAALVLIAALPVLSQLPLPRLATAPFIADLITGVRENLAPGHLLQDSAESKIMGAASAPKTAAAVGSDSAGSVSNAGWLLGALLAIWAAGAAWRMTSLLRSAFTLRRWTREAQPIAHSSLPLPGAVLQDCTVKESAAVTVPMVAGLLQPCILLPLGMRARLPSPQLALVLRHELAHIARGDTWLQLVQRLIQAIYFYNPVVHFIARRIECERECSCDDRALRASQNRHPCEGSIEYAECLLDISRQAIGVRTPALAVGAFRRPSELGARVARLLARSESENTRLSRSSVALASSALLLVAGTLSLSLPRVEAAPDTVTGRALTRELAEGTLSLDETRALLNAGADVNYALDGDGTPLILASRSGDVQLVQLLLENGADIDRFSPGDGNPLIAAAAMGNLPLIEMLLARGANVNAQDAYDETPLINAARAGHLPAVDYLIAHGADVNLAVQASTTRGSELRSPLSEARKAGYLAIVERLRQNGATH